MAKTITTDPIILAPSSTKGHPSISGLIKHVPARWLVGGVIGSSALAGMTYATAMGITANEIFYTLQIWLIG